MRLNLLQLNRLMYGALQGDLVSLYADCPVPVPNARAIRRFHAYLHDTSPVTPAQQGLVLAGMLGLVAAVGVWWLDWAWGWQLLACVLALGLSGAALLALGFVVWVTPRHVRAHSCAYMTDRVAEDDPRRQALGRVLAQLPQGAAAVQAQYYAQELSLLRGNWVELDLAVLSALLDVPFQRKP